MEDGPDVMVSRYLSSANADPVGIQCSAFGVWGLGLRVWGLGFGVEGFGFRVLGFGFRV